MPDLDAMLAEIAKIKEDGVVTKAELQEQREEAMKMYKEYISLFFYPLSRFSMSPTEILLSVPIATERSNPSNSKST
jgi:hypothetical protein